MLESMETITKRPKSVTVIGWLFASTGGFLILGALWGMILWKLLTAKLGESVVTQIYTPPPPLGIIGISPFAYMLLLAILQMGGGMFFLIAGIQFLGLRAWARTALEGISWVWVVYTVISGIWGVYRVTTLDWATLLEGLPMDTEAMKRFGLIASVVATALWTVLLIVIIRYLRSEKVRNAVSRN
jgi:hypothetical protein